MKKEVFGKFMDKVWPFLKVYIDFFIKLLYNVKGKLLNLYQNKQKTAVFLILAILLPRFLCLSVFSVGVEDEFRLDLETFCDFDRGEVCVSVVNAFSTEFCGVLFDVYFDPAVFVFDSAEKGERLSETFELSCSDLGGRVRMIIDGNENCDERIIATLRFTCVALEKSNFSRFSVFCETGEAYRFVGKSIERIGFAIGQEGFGNADETVRVTWQRSISQAKTALPYPLAE